MNEQCSKHEIGTGDSISLLRYFRVTFIWTLFDDTRHPAALIIPRIHEKTSFCTPAFGHFKLR
jgi:hypothetical protein